MLKYLITAIAFTIHISTFAQNNVDQSLAKAIKENDITQVKSLLQQGANVNAVDDDSDYMLINAAIYSTADCMELLLKKGADPLVINDSKETT